MNYDTVYDMLVDDSIIELRPHQKNAASRNEKDVRLGRGC